MQCSAAQRRTFSVHVRVQRRCGICTFRTVSQKKSIEALKDIDKIKAGNIQISKKVSMIEEVMKSETDENSDDIENESRDELEIKEFFFLYIL